MNTSKHIIGFALSILTAFGLQSCQVEEIPIGSLYDSESEALLISPDQTEVRFTADDHFDEVRIQANFWWDALIEVQHVEGEYDTHQWLEMTPTHNFGTRPVRVVMPRNIEKYDRTARVTFSSDVNSFSQTLSFIQTAAKPFVELDQTYKESSILGNQFALKLTTTEQWSLIDCPDWITIDQIAGNKCRDNSMNVTINPVVGEIPTRTAQIKFQSQEDANLMTTLNIVQSGRFDPAANLQLKNDQELILSFDKVVGAIRYDVELYRPNEEQPYYVFAYTPTEETPEARIDIDLSTIQVTDLKGHFGTSDIAVRSYLSEVVSKASDKLPDCNILFANGSGTGASFESPILVSTLRHFLNVTHAPSYFFRQTSNLDLTDQNLLPIGMDKRTAVITPFSGGYDGGKYSISNWTISITEGKYTRFGLFGEITGEVRNLTLKTPTFFTNLTPDASQTYSYGYLASKLSSGGKIVACSIEESNATIKIQNSGSYVGIFYFFGSIVGINDDGTVDNCHTKNGTIAYTPGQNNFLSFGGIAGVNGFPKAEGCALSVIRNCSNTTSINVLSTNRNTVLGGIAANSFGVIESCTNRGNLSNGSYVGGITAGTKLNREQIALINDHDIAFYTGFSISKCVNYGNLSGILLESWNTVGGICGRVEMKTSQTDPRISQSENHGTIAFVVREGQRANDFAMGGIVGWTSRANVSDCYNTGAILKDNNYGVFHESSQHHYGGISGYSSNSIVSNSFNCGAIPETGGFEKVQSSQIQNTTNSSLIVNSYSLNGRSGIVGDGTPLTSEQMKQQTSFNNWDFTNVWNMGDSYPILKHSLPKQP